MMTMKNKFIYAAFPLLGLIVLGGCASDEQSDEPEDGVSDGGDTGGDVDENRVCWESTAAECQPLSSIEPGTIGTGPAIDLQSGFPEARRGFVDADANELILAVSNTGSTSSSHYIMAVDLETGNRRVVSGTYEDPQQGLVTVGEGFDWEGLFDVRPNPATGRWIAYAAFSDDDVPEIEYDESGDEAYGLFDVDPASGDRSLLIGWGPIFTAGPEDSDFCWSENPYEMLYIDRSPYSGIEIDDEGTVYISGTSKSTAVFVAAFDVDNEDCRIVTLSANEAEPIGSGISIYGNTAYNSLTYVDGQLFALHALFETLLAIDIETGDRTNISTSGQMYTWGSGDTLGLRALLVKGDSFLSAGEYISNGSAPYVTEVDGSTGTRTQVSFSETTGPLNRGYYDEVTSMWSNPNDDSVIMEVSNAIVIYHQEDNTSVTLSY